MTNNKQLIAILSISSILIFSGFGYSPFAYSAGSFSFGDKDWDDFKDFQKWKGGGNDSEPEIESGLCQSQNNLIDNGCFESPDVNTPQGWDIYPKSQALPDWEAVWLDPENACEDFPDLPGQLELQKGILGGPAEGTQHAELDSDCGGPGSNSDGEELTSVAISQNTNVVTSDNDEYTITFAYKARPDNNIPLSTNGLSVIWNGEDITPDLKFSKTKWKYASVTVPGPEFSGPSELKFEDMGNPDTLGTFLDDVSVIKVPKPDVKIILNKEIDNSQADDTNTIIEDPSGFDIRINGQVATLGEDNPNVFQNGGDFSFTEVAPNYVATIEGVNCPEINDVDSSVTLELGDVLVCYISNTFVPPPTITLKKVITQDNTDEASELPDTSAFEMFITNVLPDSQPIPITMEDQKVPPGTYTFHETGPDNFEFVLIAGDTGCPTMNDNMDQFTLESGDHLTCVVYNDDDKDASEPDGPGVIFHYKTLEFSFDSDAYGDSCDIEENMPCVEMANGQVGSTILIVDPIIDTDTTIFLFSVIEQDKINGERPAGSMGVIASSPLCTFSGLSPHDLGYALQPIDPEDPGTFDNSVDNPSDNLGFAITCVGANPTGNYNVNYALIETVSDTA